jgi:uncharacterized protein YhaN
VNITGWSIDGCGLLHNVEVRDLKSDLTLVLGPNEAGKSTLLDFIRSMLFGTARGQVPPLPLNGGRHGGRLFVTDQGGEQWTIQRDFGGRGSLQLSANNGSVGSQADLERMLGNCDRSVFRSVFAFGLSELRAFDSSSGNDISAKIFSVGIVGAGRDASTAVKELRARQERLARPTSTTRATLNDLARQIKETRAQLLSARAMADSYQACRQSESDAEQSVARHKAELDRLRVAKARSERLIQLWPTWLHRSAAARELQDLPENSFSIGDPRKRLIEVQQLVESCRGSLRTAVEEAEEVRNKRSFISLNEQLAHHATTTARLHGALAVQRERHERLTAFDAQLKAVSSQFGERVATLGSDWDRDRIAQFDNSMQTQSRVRQWEAELSRRSERVDDRTSALDAAEQQLLQFEKKRSDLTRALQETREPLRFEAIDHFERAIAQYRASRSEFAPADQILRDREDRLGDLRRERAASLQSALPDWLWKVAAVLALASAIGAAVQAAAGTRNVAAALGGIGLVVLAAAFLAARSHASSQSALERIESDLVDATATRDEAAQQREASAAAMSSALRTLSGSDELSALEVEERALQLVTERANRNQYERLASEISAAATDIETTRSQVEGLSVQLREKIADREQGQLAWQRWANEIGLPIELSPKDAIESCRLLEHAQFALNQVKTIEMERSDLQRQVDEYDVNVRALVDAAAADGVEVNPSAELLAQLELLHDRVRDDQGRRAQAAGLDDQLRILDLRIGQRRQSVEEAIGALESVLRDAGVSDVPEFELAIERAESRARLLKVVHEADLQLTTHLGQGAIAEEMRSELASGTLDEWQSNLSGLATEIDERDAAYEQAIARRRDAQSERLRIEGSADVATAELELASLERLFATAFREWQILQLATHLVTETRAKIERERQPEVLARASDSFGRVSKSKYTRLFQRENSVVIESETGVPIQPEQLSRGTAEQLYLCMRLALAEDFRKRGQQLPLVMDDVLVNFDPERAASVAEMLCEASESQQILLFTCHPQTVEMLQRVKPSAALITMERFGVRPLPERGAVSAA